MKSSLTVNYDPTKTALLVALLLKRAGGRRARISESTLRKLSGRKRVRFAFFESLAKELDELGIIIVEMERGGFAVQRRSALAGAPAITVKRFLNEEMKRAVDFKKVKQELESTADEEEDEPDEE